MNRPVATLYYDGLCPLCSREIAHYRKKAGDALRFIDVTDPQFNAAEHGLDPKRIHRVMHVKVGDELRVGLDAFIAVWETIPSYEFVNLLTKQESPCAGSKKNRLGSPRIDDLKPNRAKVPPRQTM